MTRKLLLYFGVVLNCTYNLLSQVKINWIDESGDNA